MTPDELSFANRSPTMSKGTRENNGFTYICKMCSGRGQRAHDGRACTRCLGSGLQYRAAPRKRQSDEDALAELNARLDALR